MDKLTLIFGALSDPIRLRILALIAQETELCVCELVGALDMPQPKISRHCRALSEAGILSSRRDAQWVLYSILDDMPAWARQALDAAVSGVRQEASHQLDRDRLKQTERPPVRCETKEGASC